MLVVGCRVGEADGQLLGTAEGSPLDGTLDTGHIVGVDVGFEVGKLLGTSLEGKADGTIVGHEDEGRLVGRRVPVGLLLLGWELGLEELGSADGRVLEGEELLGRDDEGLPLEGDELLGREDDGLLLVGTLLLGLDDGSDVG